MKDVIIVGCNYNDAWRMSVNCHWMSWVEQSRRLCYNEGYNEF